MSLPSFLGFLFSFFVVVFTFTHMIKMYQKIYSLAICYNGFMSRLTFITGNENKARQLMAWLDFPLLHKKIDLAEIQTLDLEELVRHKALEAYSKIKQPALVDDTALSFHALGKLPGTFVKFFLKELELEGCCRLLDSFSDRSATALVMYGLTIDGVIVHTFLGETTGSIAKHPVGELGYGWDALFTPKDESRTFGEMSQDEVISFSPRAKAIGQLKKFLSTKLA